MSKGPKETVFDDLIEPLMRQIRAICVAEKINLAYYFALDQLKPGVLLQARHAKVHDVDDLTGMQNVLAIWETVKKSEDNFAETLPKAPEGEGN